MDDMRLPDLQANRKAEGATNTRLPAQFPRKQSLAWKFRQIRLGTL